MASLASINIKFTADLRGFSSEMQNSLRQIDKAGQQFQKIGRSMSAFVTLPILAAGAAAVKFASDYNESLNKVDVAFKSSSIQVKEFAKTTLDGFGIAEGTALDMAAAYGDMGTSMGLTTGEASAMSRSLVGLAGDLASFKNISIDIANTAIQSIFTGETESLKKMGIVMTEVNLKQFALNSGITKNYEAMGQAERVQLRYNYILSVTKNAQGDFIRTQDNAANQTRIFTESLKQVGQQLGVVILPLFTKVITVINEKIKAFSALSEGTKTTIVVVAGLVAVIGPLLLGIGAILSIIPLVAAGFAVVSGAILPILAGVVLLGGALLVLKNSFAETAEASIKLSEGQKINQRVTDEATASIVEQKSALESLLITARNENETKAARLQAIQEINRISPEYLGNLTLENINTDKARVSIEKYNAALIAGATARAASRLLEQNQTDKIKAGFEREKALADYNEKRKNAIAQGFDAEKAFYEENNRLLQFANEALDRKNAKYDAQSKILTEIYNKNKDNLKLAEDPARVADVVAPGKIKKQKAPANLSTLDSPINTQLSAGSIQAYDAEISKLIEFRDQVATTADMVKAANDRIAGIELAKALNFDPSSVIKSVQTTEEMMARLAASVSGASASIVNDQNRIKEVGELLSISVSESFGALGSSMVASLGLASTGLQGFASTMLQTLVSLIQMVVKQIVVNQALAMSNAITGATSSGVATGPGAIFTTPAFIATAIGGVIAAFASIPKFATGGVIGGNSLYGDKILARVNSGELILNSQQQSRLYGMITPNSGGAVNVTLGGGFEVSGNKLRLVLDRTDARNNRTR